MQDLSSRSLDCFYKIWCSRSRTGCQSLLLTSFWPSLWLLLVQMPQGCFRVTLHARVTATEDTEVQEWEEFYGNICLEVEHFIKGIKESVGYREFEKNKQRISGLWEGEKRRKQGEKERELKQRTFDVQFFRVEWQSGSIPVSCCIHIKNHQTIKRSLVSYLNVCSVSLIKGNDCWSSWLKSFKNVYTITQIDNVGRLLCLPMLWPSRRTSQQPLWNSERESQCSEKAIN